ncbi:hypothetical protein BC829DRAFT_104609 [Chytridium lagenaria]|nr:hypothetical protein BC829DRAFT_104609 [Chytridium lagenaria]
MNGKIETCLVADPIYTCVQCLKDYTNKENGDGACRFHKSSDFSYIGGYDKVAACCLKSDAGCSRGRHRSKNHCDYPYSQFQQWMSNILNYSDASERMAKISAFDYSCDRTREVVEISVGRILRKSDDRDKLFVKDELELADHNKPILTVQHHTGYSAQVTWIIFDGEVQGVEISCKSITSIAPARCRVRFAWPEVSDNDGPRAVSVEYDEGPSFGELPLKSGTDYNIPKERFYKGPILKVPVAEKLMIIASLGVS